MAAEINEIKQEEIKIEEEEIKIEEEEVKIEEEEVKIEEEDEDDYKDLPELIPIARIINLLFRPSTDFHSASTMGGCRCSYKTCSNTTTPWKTIHFFHYPVKQPEVCTQWIRNAEKPHFADLNEDQLRNKVICEYHFESRWFPNIQRRRLVKGAVPTLDGDSLVKQEPPVPIPQTLSIVRENIIPRPPPTLATPKINCISSNGDHAVFLLEDPSTAPKTENVESYYIYQNGSLVSSKAIENSSGLHIADVPNQNENTADTNHSVFQDVDREDSRNAAGTSSHENLALFWDSSPEGLETNTPPSSHNDQLASTSGVQMTKAVRNNVVTNNTVNNHSLSNIEKRIEAKIRKQSREITAIKKHLRSAKVPKRSLCNKAYLLRALKAFIPPTLYSVIKMNLTNSVVTPDDWKFFIRLHEKSPAMYNMLSEECKWKLPDIEMMRSLLNGQKK